MEPTRYYQPNNGEQAQAPGMKPETELAKQARERQAQYGAIGQSVLGTIGDAQKLPPGQTKYATGPEGQMWQGIEQQQQQAQALANRRGFSPLAARGAAYTGAEMESSGYGMANQLRAAMEAQRRGEMLGALGGLSKAELEGMGIDTQALQGELNRMMQEDQIRQQEILAKRAEEQGNMSTGLQVAGTVFQLGKLLLSDINLKQNIEKPSGEKVDELMGTLGSAPVGEPPAGGIEELYQGIYGQPISSLPDETPVAPPEAAAPMSEVEGEIAALGQQLEGMTPFEQMIALNRGKAVPASERLASTGEAIGAASVAADKRLKPEPLSGSQLTGRAREVYDSMMAQIYGPVNPGAPSKPKEYAEAERNAPQIAAALEAGNPAMRAKLGLPSVAQPADSYQAFKQQQERQRYQQEVQRVSNEAERIAKMTDAEKSKAFADSLVDLDKQVEQQLLRGEKVDTSVLQDAAKSMGDAIRGTIPVPPMPPQSMMMPGEASPKQYDDTMENLSANEYNYKPEVGKPGRQVGIMAQDLEKSKLGKNLVVNSPQGKFIDTNQAVGASLGMIGRLNDRMAKLEKRNG